MESEPSGLFFKFGVRIFHNICFAVTIVLVVWQILVYVENNDISRVAYEKFHSDEVDIYPSLSLCFGDILLQGKLDNHEVNKSYYLDFLKGLVWNEKLLEINYSDVSINLEDHLLGIEMYQEKFNGDIETETYHLFDNTRNLSSRTLESTQWKPDFTQNSSPFYGLIQKCLTVDVPYTPNKRLSWITIIMSKSVFASGRRPFNMRESSDMFSVDIHYPNQRLRYSKTKRDWNAEEPNATDMSSYGMKFYVFGLEVMNKRNTRRTPCNEDRTIDDHKIRQRMITDIGCIPPYWTLAQQGSKKPICSNRTQLEQYFQMNITTFTVPCRRMTQITFLYSEYVSDYYHSRLQNIRNQSEDVFFVSMMFPDSRYKQIEMLREVNMQSLIGNAGGFVGICVGYSILQFPNLLLMIYGKLKSITMEKKTSSTTTYNTKVSTFVMTK